MKMIKRLAEAIECNVDEAREKILTAYEIKDKYPQTAVWYKDMAAAHLGFNNNGHTLVSRMISEYKDSDDYRMHPEYVDGMMAVWNEKHAYILKRSAEVQSMISSFK